MPVTLYEQGAPEAKKPETAGARIVPGTVINNCDLALQGKVLVRIPSLNLEVWARLSAVGGGSGAGMLYVPRIDDEVLVGIHLDGDADAYILGGLWTTQDGPPALTPLDAQTKRVIKTGLKGGVGHTIEFDDGLGQSITITSSAKQRITIDPFKIELSNAAGTLKVVLDNETQTITIQGVNIELKGTATLSLSAPKIDIQADAQVSVASKLDCSVSGKPVRIN